jgi:hypothetical protein
VRIARRNLSALPLTSGITSSAANRIFLIQQNRELRQEGVHPPRTGAILSAKMSFSGAQGLQQPNPHQNLNAATALIGPAPNSVWKNS